MSVDDIHSTVAKQLDAAGLGNVKVDVDKDKSLITLTGDVNDDAVEGEGGADREGQCHDVFGGERDRGASGRT